MNRIVLGLVTRTCRAVTFGIGAAFMVPLCSAQTQDVIADVRVHGNHTTPAADVLALSGLVRGEIASAERLQQAERTLLDSGRFAGVELRRRLASIDDPSAILVMILVDEHEAVSDDDLTPGPFDRMRAAAMWLPIVHHADGYGFTYGARVSFVDVAGARSRVSVPMTWGGERRIGLEVERALDGPVPVVRGSLALTRRVNPHFDVADLRQEARVEAERAVTAWLRTGAHARVADVGFGDGYDARHTAAGLQVTLDTRLDPSFPRDAIHARLGWEHLWWSDSGGRGPDAGLRSPAGGAGRWLADIRGYLGLTGSSVLALRGALTTSTAAVPAPEHVLLGGSGSLRGYRAGHRAGGNAASLSAELRVPVSSPLNTGRLGVKAFVDAGTAWPSGERLVEQRFDRGIGGGIYFGVAAVVADLDVAWPERGKPRLHVGLGVGF